MNGTPFLVVGTHAVSVPVEIMLLYDIIWRQCPHLPRRVACGVQICYGMKVSTAIPVKSRKLVRCALSHTNLDNSIIVAFSYSIRVGLSTV